MGIRGYMKDFATVAKYHAQFKTTADEIVVDAATAKRLFTREEDRSTTDRILATLTTVVEQEQGLHKAAADGDTDAFVANLSSFVQAVGSQQGESDKLLQHQQVNLTTDTDGALASIESSRWITGILLALSAAIGIVIVFVVRGINTLLSSSVVELAESAEQIAAAANQVSSSSQSLAQGSSEQAATIEETSSVSVEINSMAQRNTENSKQTAGIVTDSEAGFQKANNSLSEMVVAMEGISTSSQKISKIIKVIDEIAFQTNILALNAAVEAARAGDAGMGFAVVADEVRNLAQRCAQAAKDTTDLIEDSIEKSDSGMTKVDQVAIAIREITAQSAQIKTLVDEINLGSIEQSRGIDQISTSIGQMEQVTQSSAANAEETAAAAEQLSAQAKAMKDVVARLRSMVQSESRPSALRSPASHIRTRSIVPSSTRGASKTKFAQTVPRTSVRTHVSASILPKPSAVAAAAFPMDEDFKEF